MGGAQRLRIVRCTVGPTPLGVKVEGVDRNSIVQ